MHIATSHVEISGRETEVLNKSKNVVAWSAEPSVPATEGWYFMRMLVM